MEKVNVNVIFRKDKRDNTVIAFFIEDYANGKFVCYEHMGQHGNASLEYYQSTKKATKSEYKALKQELESIGYNVTVKQRMKYN